MKTPRNETIEQFKDLFKSIFLKLTSFQADEMNKREESGESPTFDQAWQRTSDRFVNLCKTPFSNLQKLAKTTFNELLTIPLFRNIAAFFQGSDAPKGSSRYDAFIKTFTELWAKMKASFHESTGIPTSGIEANNLAESAANIISPASQGAAHIFAQSKNIFRSGPDSNDTQRCNSTP
jgi:hypothetical protein